MWYFFLLPLSSLFLSYLFLPSFSVRLILNIVNESTENKTAGWEKKWNDGVSVWREGVNTLGQSLRFSLNTFSIYLLVTMTTRLQPSQISQPGVQLHWLQNTLLTCHNTLPTQHPALHLIYRHIHTNKHTQPCSWVCPDHLYINLCILNYIFMVGVLLLLLFAISTSCNSCNLWTLRWH